MVELKLQEISYPGDDNELRVLNRDTLTLHLYFLYDRSVVITHYVILLPHLMLSSC